MADRLRSRELKAAAAEVTAAERLQPAGYRDLPEKQLTPEVGSGISASVPAITHRSPISRADVSGAIPSVTDARYAVAAVPSSIAVARIAPITVVGYPIPIAVGWRIVIVIGNWRIAITVIAAIAVAVATVAVATIAVAPVAVRITVATRVIGSGERGTNDGTRGKPKPRTTPATTAVTPTAVAPTAITEGPSLSSG